MRRIRNLGLALIATLALAASMGVASAGAAGTGFLAKEYGAIIEVKPLGNMTLGIAGTGMTCIESGYKGGITEQTSPLYVESLSSEIPCTGSPETYWGKPILKTQGCSFTITPGPSGGKSSFGIGPSGCGPMVIYSKVQGCELKLAPQTVPISIEKPLTVEGSPSSVKASLLASLQYTNAVGTCPEKGTVNLQTSWLLRATGPGGSFTGLYLGDENGFFFNEAKGLFESEAKPLTVAGGQDPANKYALKFGGLPAVSCAAVDLKATVSVSQYQVPGGTSTAQLPASASYAGCGISLLGKVRPVTIEMNSCNYTLNGAGTVDIACKTAEDAIKINFYEEKIGGSTLCQYKILPQKGLKGVKYGTAGSGADRGVSVALELSGIATSRTSGGPLLCGPENGTATHTGGTTLFGQ